MRIFFTGLFILLQVCSVSVFAQRSEIPQQATPDARTERGILHRSNSSYKNKQLINIRFYGQLSEGQKALLAVNGCELIGYKGNNNYLASLQTDARSRVQTIPFVHSLSELNNEEKALPGFGTEIPSEALQSKNEIWLDLLTLPDMSRDEIEKLLPKGALLLQHYPSFDLARVKVAKKQLSSILAQAWVLWADYIVPDRLFNQLGATETRTGSLQFNLPHLTGKGINIGVWDGSAIIGPHVDFVNRQFQQEPFMGEALGWRNHATHVSGTIASAGLRFIHGRGMAPEARLFSHNIVSTGTVNTYIPYEMIQAAEQHGIVITNNSYGPAHTCLAGGVNYTSVNRSQDLVANAFPELLHVFSAGNNGAACGGFRNTVNGAKNIISVASIAANDTRMWGSSIQSAGGPTRDGRLQPHIAALGVNVFSTMPDQFYASSGWSGTSMAAPHVSGVAALVYQQYKALHNSNPPAALVRAVLLNGATDLGNPGPDYVFGYGKLHAANAITAITNHHFRLDQVAQGQSQTHTVNVPPGSLELKIMLSWNDPAGLPGASPALVNNLDLQAKSPSGTIVLPLVLDPSNPAAVAVQGVDNLNNNEQIIVTLPEAGTWEISVGGTHIAAGGQQPYALTWQTEGEFLTLRNPTTIERDLSPVIWDSRGITGNVTIEFFNGTSWSTLGTAPAAQGRFAWTPPAVVTNNARIRISATGQSGAAHSETSPPLIFLGVPNITPNPNSFPYTAGNNSLTFSWSAASGAEAYEILWLNLQKGRWEIRETVPASTTTYTLTGLENGTRHWLSVRVRNNTLNASGNFAYAGFGTPAGAGPAQDIALTQVAQETPAGSCFAPMQPQAVRITLQNKGNNPIPAGVVVPVAYRINEGLWINEDLTLTDELAVNQSVEYTFAQTFTPTTAEEVSIEAQANWSSDSIFTNNSAVTSVRIPEAIVPVVSANPALAACLVPTTVSIAGIPDDDYALQSIAFQPQDMSAATEISLTNDGASDAIPIGFPFKFYNNLFEEVFISAEGFLTFRNIDFDFINFLQRPIPNPFIINDFVALAWNNMRFVTGSKIRYQTTGTAPHRRFTVEFLDMAQENDSTKRVSGQIMLYESSNRIELHIDRIDASPLTAIISGIENNNGSTGVALPGMNNQSISSDIIAQAWSFTPVANGFQWLDNGSNSTSRLFTTAGDYTFRYERNNCTIEQTITVCNTSNVPAIAPVADVITPEDVTANVPVLITYGTQDETTLTILQSSDNPALIPDANLIWIGTGTDRVLQIIPLPNQYGTAQITITATDGVQTAVRTFQVVVTPVNDPPVVSGFSVNLLENAVHIFAETQFTNHYSDIENEPLVSIKILTLPANGQLRLNNTPLIAGTVISRAQIVQLSYRPNLDFTGTDNFQWTASDGTDFASAPAVVSLHISSRPEPVLPIPTIDAIADVIMQEDTPVSIPVRIRYGELSDELLDIQIITDDNTLLPRSAFRWISSNSNRQLLITPPANQFGQTQARIVVSNGRNSAVRQFSVQILPVNDAPVISVQQIGVKSGQAFAFSLPFFDTVYTDIENDPLATVRISKLPQNGQLRIADSLITSVPVLIDRNRLNQLTYQAHRAFTGADSFEWQASDGTDLSNSARVQIQVWNTPPQVSDLQRRIHWRQSLVFGYADWQAAFSDADGDLPKELVIWGNTIGHWRYNNHPIISGAPLLLTNATQISFHPERGRLGLYRFFWNASDGTAQAAQTAEINITVWNTPPTIADIALEGSGEIRFAADKFAAAYTDADNDSIVSVRITALPQSGQLFWRDRLVDEATVFALDQLEDLRYQPLNANAPQPDRIGWIASDGAEASNLAFVNLTVQPLVNRLPQVLPFSKKAFENQVVNFNISDFTDHYDHENSRPAFVRFTQLPFHGMLRMGSEPVVIGRDYPLQQMAQLTYQPRIDFVGTDGLFFTAGTSTTVAPQAALISLEISLQPISAPENLRIAANRLNWQRPSQGNIKQYEVQAQVTGNEMLVVHTFTTEENFALPPDLAIANLRIRVRAWGFHNNAGPFTEWLQRQHDIVANAPEIIVAPRSLQVYPNPASEHIFIQWSRMPDAQLKLVDASGRIIADWHVTTESGTQPIDTQGLSSGVYRIQTIYAGQRYVCTFVIVR